MLDSLVRVSRRVGWRADRFATDPGRQLGKHPHRNHTGKDRHCKAVPAPTAAAGHRVTGIECGRGLVPRSPSWPMQKAGYNTPHRSAELPSCQASDSQRTGRGAPSRPSARGQTFRSRPVLRSVYPTTVPPALVEWPGRTLRFHPFTSKRFHVLLNSLFKVLFNFPSRYLSAIGLVSVFSLRWSLPPSLGCIPKQPDSEAACGGVGQLR